MSKNLELCRADDGSGGWSLHTPEGDLLISGPSEADASGDWIRPDQADWAAAEAAAEQGLTYQEAPLTRAVTIRARITERGNGFPNVGDYVYDSATDTVYTVSSMGRIQTRQYAGNWVDAELEDTGLSASDLTDEEFDDITCSVTVVA